MVLLGHSVEVVVEGLEHYRRVVEDLEEGFAHGNQSAREVVVGVENHQVKGECPVSGMGRSSGMEM